MKIKLYKLALFITALFIFGCTSSDDDFDSESSSANETSQLEYERVPFMVQSENAKLNDNSLRKSENKNNGNGVYIVPFYSDNPGWFAEFPIEDQDGKLTHVLVIDFPLNGEDRALVFSETEMMVNFNSQGPVMYIYELGVGVTYHSYCKVRDGFYKGRIKTTYIGRDYYEPFDGVIDNYWWGPGTKDEPVPTVTDKNGRFHVKATLSSTSGSCGDSTIDFSYTYQIANGKITQTSSLH